MSQRNKRARHGKSHPRSLVISIDIGTTFTAASFCISQSGHAHKFEEVLRWPKQAISDAKIPSVIYYDTTGKACAFGAETEDETTILEAEENGWYKTEWWKLHLRPKHLHIIHGLKLPEIPPQVTVDDIYTHHMQYVKLQVQNYVTTSYGDGENLWRTLSPSMYVILTTPNGWEGLQQNRMREAAVRGGLVDAEGRRRIRFVTEAEAAILYAANSGNVDTWFVKNGHVILCDCGGGTIDITGYKINTVKPLKLEESSASRCYLAGAVFVTQAAMAYIKEHLRDTCWGSEESLQRIMNHFDKHAKLKFEDIKNPSYIQVDGLADCPELGITRGKLKISGEKMASFFEQPLKCITEGLEISIDNGDKATNKIILVGGLASSPYVYSKLVMWGKERGIFVSRPDGPAGKAVANGALAWHLNSPVCSRVAKYFYGTDVRMRFDITDSEHIGREKIQVHNGGWFVKNGWSAIANKNDKIVATKEFKTDYFTELTDDSDMEVEEKVFVYRRLSPPQFITFPGKSTLQPGFDVICTISANLEQCYRARPYLPSKIGDGYYKSINYSICLSLGDTEIKARLSWEQDGVLTYGLAVITYD